MTTPEAPILRRVALKRELPDGETFAGKSRRR